MDIFELMESRKNSFSNTDRKIYENIRKFPDRYATGTISEIVEEMGFSQAALTRFAKRLGFDGFNLFQYQFRMDYQSPGHNKEILSPAVIYGSYLKKVEDSISDDILETTAQKIRSSRNIILAGSHVSSLPAQYMHMIFNISQTAASFLYHPEVGAPPLTKDDLYILFSVNSGTAQKQLLEKWDAKENIPYKILITVSSRHTLRKYFDEIIVLPETDVHDIGYAVLPDTLAFLLFCEMLSRKLIVE